MWRPKNWKGLKGLHSCNDCYCLTRARDSGRSRDYEAGADAMLEALKKTGWVVEAEQKYKVNDINGFEITPIKKGTLVIISEGADE